MKKAESKNIQTPKLRHHKATGQAYAVLNGHAIYFGRYSTQEATENYHKTIAEWLSCGKQVAVEGADITINEVVARFWVHAENYYRGPDGMPTSELDSLVF